MPVLQSTELIDELEESYPALYKALHAAIVAGLVLADENESAINYADEQLYMALQEVHEDLTEDDDDYATDVETEAAAVHYCEDTDPAVRSWRREQVQDIPFEGYDDNATPVTTGWLPEDTDDAI